MVIHPYNQPEWYLGHLHYPPYYIRAIFNNKTAEFDKDSAWLLRRDKKKQTSSSLIHSSFFQTLIKVLGVLHGPLSQSQIDSINKALHGSDQFGVISSIGGESTIGIDKSNKLLLTQLASINGLNDVNLLLEDQSNAGKKVSYKGRVIQLNMLCQNAELGPILPC